MRLWARLLRARPGLVPAFLSVDSIANCTYGSRRRATRFFRELKESGMAEAPEKVLRDALALSPVERAALIDELISR